MSKPLLQSAAVSVLCLLTGAGPALAAHHHHARKTHAVHQAYSYYGSTMPYEASTAAYPYYSTAAAASPIVGTYTSNAFYPSPLDLTITGVDANGNVYGTMWGMQSQPGPDKEEPSWKRWTTTFPSKSARAIYRNGQVAIQFRSGGGYTLTLNGNTLTGKFNNSSGGREVTFLRQGANGYAMGR